MDCTQARERILETFDGGQMSLEQEALLRHLSTCEPCARFLNFQHALEGKLEESMANVALSPGFATRLRTKLRTRRLEWWPSWLPDVAYLSGTTLGVVLCVELLPLPAAVVVPLAVGFAIAAYVVQVTLAAVLEEVSG
jgi:hypothetical protein